MSCKNCDDMKDVAYIRINSANVGIIGCDEHAGIAIRAINAVATMEEILEEERVVFRVKYKK